MNILRCISRTRKQTISQVSPASPGLTPHMSWSTLDAKIIKSYNLLQLINRGRYRITECHFVNEPKLKSKEYAHHNRSTKNLQTLNWGIWYWRILQHNRKEVASSGLVCPPLHPVNFSRKHNREAAARLCRRWRQNCKRERNSTYKYNTRSQVK